MTGFSALFIDQSKRQGDQHGIERGVQQGIQEVIQHQRHMLARQIRKRFGDDAAGASEPRLARIDDPERLDDLAEALLESAHRRLATNAANVRRLSARSTPTPFAAASKPMSI